MAVQKLQNRKCDLPNCGSMRPMSSENNSIVHPSATHLVSWLFCLASPAARIALPIQWSPHIPLAAKMATSLKALRLNVFAIYFEGLSKAQDPDHCLVHSGGGG